MPDPVNDRRPSRAATAALSLIVAAVLVVVVRSSPIPSMMQDFDVYWRAAWNVRHGVPVYQQPDGFLTYQYFPWLAVLITPFTWLDLRWAESTWAVIVAAAVAGTAAGSGRLAGVRRVDRSHLWLALAFLPLVWEEVTEGQVNAIVMCASLWALAAEAAGRVAAGAFRLTVAAVAKPHAMVLWPWLAWRRHRAVWLAAVALALLLALAAFILPGATPMDWWRQVIADSIKRGPVGPNTSIVTWASQFTQGTAAAAVWAVAGLVVLGAFLVRALRDADLAAGAALLFAAVPLITPQAWFGQQLYLLPAAVLVNARRAQLGAFGRSLFAAVLLYEAVAVTGLELIPSPEFNNAIGLSLSVATACVLGLCVRVRAPIRLGQNHSQTS